MVNDKTLLYDYKRSNSDIQLANSSSITSHGQGTLSLTPDLKLNDVIHAPHLSHNLLSTAQLNDIGIGVYHPPTAQSYMELPNNTVFSLHREGNLFMLPSLSTSLLQTKAFQTINSKYVTNPQTLHCRLGHYNYNTLLQYGHKCYTNYPKLTELPDDLVCQSCTQGKLHKSSVGKSHLPRSTQAFQVLHCDLSGHISTTGYGNYHYWVSFVDDYTKYCFIYFLHSKSDVHLALQQLLVDVKQFTTNSISVIHSDQAGELYGGQFKQLCSTHQIKQTFSTPHRPDLNGVAERYNRTYAEMGRTLMLHCSLPTRFWPFAISCATYLMNRTPSRAIQFVTPYEKLTSKKPDFRHFKIFGCAAQVLKYSYRRKFDSKTTTCIFLGYDINSSSHTYIFYNPATNKILKSRDAAFFESEFPFNKESKSLPSTPAVFDEIISISSSNPVEQQQFLQASDHENDSTTSDDDQLVSAPGTPCSGPGSIHFPSAPSSIIDEQASDSSSITSYEDPNDSDFYPSSNESDIAFLSIVSSQLDTKLATIPVLGLNVQVSSSPDHSDTQYLDLINDNIIREPTSYYQAINDPLHGKYWNQASDSEYNQCEKLGTFEWLPRSDLPKNAKVLRCKWVYKLKPDKYKARIVVKGFMQNENDYTELFAAGARPTTVRLLFNHYSQRPTWLIFSADVSGAFLNAKLDPSNPLFMEAPPGFERPGQVIRLIKSLYGLKQAPHEWQQFLHNILLKFGLHQSKSDSTFYFNHDKNFYMTFHVDDFLILTRDQATLDAFKAHMIQHLSKTVEDKDPITFKQNPTAYLGMDIEYTPNHIKLHQSNYLTKFLNHDSFNMCDSKTRPTPAPAYLNNYVPTSTEPVLDAEHHAKYRSGVARALFAAISTRPDILYTVTQLSKYLVRPTQQCWSMLKHLLRYLNGTRSLGLLYRIHRSSDQPPPITLTAYTDADWAKPNFDPDTQSKSRRSVSGHLILSNTGGVIYYSSKTQTSTALSSCEAEYISCSLLCKEVRYLRNLFPDFGNPLHEPTPVYLDNQSALKSAQNQDNKRMKHLEVAHFHIKDLLRNGTITLHYVQTEEQLADIFTKILPRDQHSYLRTHFMSVVPVCGGVLTYKSTDKAPTKTVRFNVPEPNHVPELTDVLEPNSVLEPKTCSRT